MVGPLGFYGGRMPIINGTDNSETLTGTPDADTINGLGGDDTIHGGGGADTINGGLGNDIVNGDGGNDSINSNAGIDSIYGGEGNDIIRVTLDGSAGVFLVDGGIGDDFIEFNPFGTLRSDVNVIGGEGNDFILVGQGRISTVDGGAGDDHVVIGGAVTEATVTLGSGSNVVSLGFIRFGVGQGSSDSTFVGVVTYLTDYQPGIDQLGINWNFPFFLGWSGANNPFAEGFLRLFQVGNDAVLRSFNSGSNLGADRLIFQNTSVSSLTAADLGGYDPNGAVTAGLILNGTDGNDDIVTNAFGVTSGLLLGGVGADTIDGRGGDDDIFGGAGNDLIQGGSGNDYLEGGIGDDIIDGGTGDDTMVGGYGNDVFIVSSIGDRAFDFNPFVGSGGGADEIRTTLTNYTLNPGHGIERLVYIGTESATLRGDTNANVLIGGNGNDTLTGAAGSDLLSGGAGNDIFRDTAVGLSGDTLTDFATGDNIIFTDATLAGFTFNLSGNTLTYSGGSLTLQSFIGPLIASTAAGGGVQLTVGTAAINDVRNDFNGDGRSDILWRNVDGQMSNWLGQANGGFVQNNANAADVVPSAWQIAGTGDFNGDGRDDILWRNVDGQLSNWLATAAGGFTQNNANAAVVVPTSWQVVGTGDFNGDGRDDILWRNTDGTVSNWLGTASGGFTPNDTNAARFVPTSWTVVGTGDFNGDGRDDILWRNDNGQLSNWLGQANGGFVNNGAVAGTFVPLAWSVVAIGDYNGDGRDDILWRNTNGTVTDWLGNANGSFTPNDANAATVVPTAWHVQPEAPFL